MAGSGFIIGSTATTPLGDLLKDQYGAQQLGVGDVLDIGAAADRSTQLVEGTYRISGNADCWFKQGGSTVAAVADTAGNAFLAAGAIDTFTVDDASNTDYLSIIRDGSEAGKLSITKQ